MRTRKEILATENVNTELLLDIRELLQNIVQLLITIKEQDD